MKFTILSFHFTSIKKKGEKVNIYVLLVTGTFLLRVHSKVHVLVYVH